MKTELSRCMAQLTGLSPSPPALNTRAHMKDYWGVQPLISPVLQPHPGHRECKGGAVTYLFRLRGIESM